MTPTEQRIVKDLVKRIRAQDRFLVAYRTGGKPSEKAFQDVRATANAVNEAEAMLQSGTAED